MSSSEWNLRSVAGRSSHAAIGTSSSAPATHVGDQTGAVRRPDSTFTIVEADETISDVAVRVYGTTDEVDALRRANLDSLPTNDTTLSAGMLLHTPRLR